MDLFLFFFPQNTAIEIHKCGPIHFIEICQEFR